MVFVNRYRFPARLYAQRPAELQRRRALAIAYAMESLSRCWRQVWPVWECPSIFEGE